MKKSLGLFLLIGLVGVQAILAQGDDAPLVLRAPALPTPAPAPKLSVVLTKILDESDKAEVPREKREQAYAKLLEGQRYVFRLRNQRNAMTASTVRLARAAFQSVVELDPTISEAYTGLAEIVLSQPPGDINEALALAGLGIRVNPDNFGSRRIVARLLTIKSRFNEDRVDKDYLEKSVAAWENITRLDPRNSEAWAFLAELHRIAGRNDQRIESLKRWLSAAAPIETRFYQTMMGRDSNLSPEFASAKLGRAYLETGRTREAVETLNQVVADEPDNPENLQLLSEALDKADTATATSSIQALQQAIYANPDSTPLITLLAKIQAKTGGLAEGAKVIDDAVNRIAERNKNGAASLLVSLGDIFRDAGKTDDAVVNYRKALKTIGISAEDLATDDDRELAVGIFERVIRAYKSAGRINDAVASVADARKVLGEEDSFADRQLIAIYRENGRREDALKALQFARAKFPEDYGLLRQTAQVLGELGRVDEGVEMVRSLIGKKPTGPPTPMYDDFTNYLFISTLYAEARRGTDAVTAAKKAGEVARGGEQKQIAQLQLATAQEKGGDFAGAEATLRELLAASPNNPIAQNNLGYFLADRNLKLDEALKLIESALKIDPENPSYLDSLAWVYYRKGMFREAEALLTKAIGIDASSATLHDHLGDVYFKLGDKAKARAAWQKALTLSADPTEVESLKAKLNGKEPR